MQEWLQCKNGGLTETREFSDSNIRYYLLDRKG